MTNLTLKVDGAPGADCSHIITEMCALAERLQICVSASLNGVTTIAMPGCDPDELAEAWHAELNSDRSYKVVCGHAHSAQRR